MNAIHLIESYWLLCVSCPEISFRTYTAKAVIHNEPIMSYTTFQELFQKGSPVEKEYGAFSYDLICTFYGRPHEIDIYNLTLAALQWAEHGTTEGANYF